MIQQVSAKRLPMSWLIASPKRVPTKMKFKLLEKEFSLDNYNLWCQVAKVSSRF